MKLTKNVQCKKCNGCGSSDGKSYVCRDCGGSGQREAVRQIGFGMLRQTVTCPACNGQGEAIPYGKQCGACTGKKFCKEDKILDVEIEKGMKDGEHIIFRGESHEATGYIPGDVVFVIQEKEHPIFHRKDSHLFLEKKIPLVNALTGFQFVVEHVSGQTLLISTPAGMIISPGLELEVVEGGMPVRNFPSDKGSLLVKFTVEFPTKLSQAQVSGLLNALPGRIPPVDGRRDVTQVMLQEVDRNNFNRDEAHHGGGALDSSDEEEGGGQPGVACAQQ